MDLIKKTHRIHLNLIRKEKEDKGKKKKKMKQRKIHQRCLKK